MRLEDIEISTDAVDQTDDELEAIAASLNKKLQVSIGSATGSGPDSDQYNPSEKAPRLVIPPKLEQKFKALLRKQIQSIKKDSKVMVTNDNDQMIPTTNRNFATINKAHPRLTKSSPPQIPVQPMNVVSPVPPPAPHL